MLLLKLYTVYNIYVYNCAYVQLYITFTYIILNDCKFELCGYGYVYIYLYNSYNAYTYA